MADNFFKQFHEKKSAASAEPRSAFLMDEDGLMRAIKKSELKGDRGDSGKDGLDGADGNDGLDGRGIADTLLQGEELYVQYSDGIKKRVGRIVGRDGKDGRDGRDGINGRDGVDGLDAGEARGITSASINADGELIITFSDGQENNLGKVKGEDGAHRIVGGSTNIGVGVQNNGTTVGNGFSVLNFVGAIITKVDRKVTITLSGGGGSGDVVGPASSTDNAIARFDGITGKLIQNSAATIADTSGNILAGTYNGNTIGAGTTSGTNTGDQIIVTPVNFTVDGGGVAITTGKVKGFFTIPYSGNITAWNLVADVGTCTIKVWKIATGTAKPTSANSINTSGVSLSSGTAIRSTILSDFTSVAVSANDIITFNIETIAGGMTELSGGLEITKT